MLTRVEQSIHRISGCAGAATPLLDNAIVLLLDVVGAPDGERGDASEEYDEHRAREDGSTSR